ncbi:alpha/beta hydrolase [Gracilibacillus phocaeensis]|uniref:alpha/beta hydrolase n=1 Tax=Gracilibacillus phocaeensis TaxID=2042304 RepID=UPI0010311F3A|nr:alpha/beta hydrolase [Gracilibacillus phocaeensis]
MFNQKEITIPAAYPLQGTFTFPDSEQVSYPTVLIIPGSGEIDRNGDTAEQPAMYLYQDIAEALAARGYASFRYDKRGLFESEGDFLETGFYDFIEDAVHCIHHLREVTEVNAEQIYLLGHSEGAMITPAIQKQEEVQGIILLSGLAESIIDLTNRQNDAFFEQFKQGKSLKSLLYRLFKIDSLQKKVLNKQRNKILFSDQEVMMSNGRRINAKYIREFWRYNVCEILPAIHCPTFSLTGANDQHVPPDHAQTIAELVSGQAEWQIIPEINHFLRKGEDQPPHQQTADFIEQQSKLSLANEVITKITSWLDNQMR